MCSEIRAHDPDTRSRCLVFCRRHPVDSRGGKVGDRRCFIEKTPRVFDPSLGMFFEDWRSWVPGDKGSAPEYGLYAPSREFADRFARLLGYTIEE